MIKSLELPPIICVRYWMHAFTGDNIPIPGNLLLGNDSVHEVDHSRATTTCFPTLRPVKSPMRAAGALFGASSYNLC